MFDLFSDIFACRDNVLTRMDARAKLIIASGMILAVILSRKMYLPLTSFVVCVSAMIALRMPVRLVLLRLAGPLGIVVVLVAVKAFFTAGTPLASFPVFGWHLTASREGLYEGVLLGSRVMGSVSVMVLLGSVTPAYKIFHALRWFRIPEGWVEIALLVYRYTFTLLDQTADVAAAQSARLGYSNVRRSLSSMGVLAGTVITRSMDQAMRTYEAMMLRGYQGHLPFAPLPKMSISDRRSIILALPLIVASYVLLEWWAR
jgi:cobalt/nickel transport system permease protein